jgi:hypothetical protein
MPRGGIAPEQQKVSQFPIVPLGRLTKFSRSDKRYIITE